MIFKTFETVISSTHNELRTFKKIDEYLHLFKFQSITIESKSILRTQAELLQN